MNVGDHKDWKDGIDPTEEDRARFERIRADLEACRDIIDELFPEDKQKPPTPDPTKGQKRWSV